MEKAVISRRVMSRLTCRARDPGNKDFLPGKEIGRRGAQSLRDRLIVKVSKLSRAIRLCGHFYESRGKFA